MRHSRRKLISSTPEEAPGPNLQTLTKTTVVPAAGLEPATLGLRVPCSNQLSHAGQAPVTEFTGWAEIRSWPRDLAPLSS